jgi:alpha-D-xyloside xylohydrolase
MHETYDAMSLPLLARPNSVIPFGAVDTRPDYAYADGVTFHVFELAEGATASAVVPSLEGEVAMRLRVRREGDTITAEAEDAAASWSVLLRGINRVASVEGGHAEPDARGVRVVPDGNVQRLRVAL